MKCEKCGFYINQDDHFCQNCGTPVSVSNNNNTTNTNYNDNTTNQNMNSNVNNYQNSSINQNNFQNQNLNQEGVQDLNSNPLPTNNNQSKSRKALFIVLTILLVGGIFTYNFIKNYNEYFGKDRTPITISGSEVVVGDVTFTIPYNLKYQLNNGALYIADKDETWYASISILDMKYENIKKNKENLVKTDTTMGYITKNVNIKSYENIEFVTVELEYATNSSLGAYSKLDKKRILSFEFATSNGTIDYSILDEIALIAAAARVNK